MAFDMKDYKDVAERIAEFSAKYPEGSLQSDLTPLEKDGVLVGWLCRAYAYRSPSDERPGVGHAVEPVPGKTPYTRDSEAMNAETSAWGRAIIALGFRTKKIASRQEVEGRQEAGEGTSAPARGKRKEAPNGSAPPAAGTPPPEDDSRFATQKQRRYLFAIAKENSVDTPTLKTIVENVTGQGSTAQIPRELFDKVIVAVQTYQLAASLSGEEPFE